MRRHNFTYGTYGELHVASVTHIGMKLNGATSISRMFSQCISTRIYKWLILATYSSLCSIIMHSVCFITSCSFVFNCPGLPFFTVDAATSIQLLQRYFLKTYVDDELHQHQCVATCDRTYQVVIPYWTQAYCTYACHSQTSSSSSSSTYSLSRILLHLCTGTFLPCRYRERTLNDTVRTGYTADTNVAVCWFSLCGSIMYGDTDILSII